MPPVGRLNKSTVDMSARSRGRRVELDCLHRSHPEPGQRCHEEMLEWRGQFFPEAFDAKKATKEMRNVK